jgi:predicted ATPase
MIIELHNFGPIERFTFDTEKRMHFIFGENNVGKSYAITAVYLILKNWEKSFEKPEKIYEFESKMLQLKLKSLKSEIDISFEINSIVSNYLRDLFLPILEESLSNSFSNLRELTNKHSRKPFQIIIKNDELEVKLIQKDSNLSVQNILFNKKIILKQIENNAYSYEYDIFSDIHIGDSIERTSLIMSSIFRDYLIGKDKKVDIYFLPASRSGIYNGLSAWSAILVQLTQFRSQNKDSKFEIPTLTEPISDYFLNLTNIDRKAYSTTFSKFAKRIEDEIIKGKINFDKSNRKLYYEPANLDLSLELSQASSMISEIAPIIAHLKFIFDNNDNRNGQSFLFIEEPEAHLHPKVQVALIQLFAEMSKEGLHVVMTSHSNYMFNKLSNMVLAKEIAPETISVGLMKLGEKGSYIDENAMHIDEDGIDDDNFSETAEALYTERLKLYEQNPS